MALNLYVVTWYIIIQALYGTEILRQSAKRYLFV